MTKALVVAVGLLSGGVLSAAPMKLNFSDEVKMALRLPLNNRVASLQNHGPEAFGELQKIALSETEPMELRWRAVTSVGRLAPVKAKDFLDKCLRSQDWYMRNAALVVVPYGERTWAVSRAKAALKDKALMVRTAAVKSLQALNAIEAEEDLWESLYAPGNYKGGQSLWIRKHILETLAPMASAHRRKDFLRVLKEDDAELHPQALKALSRITSKNWTRDQWLSM